MADFNALFTLSEEQPINATFTLNTTYNLTSEQVAALDVIKIDGAGTKFLADNGVYKSGGGGGTTDYTDLDNKPSINSITLNGNKTSADLGLLPTNTTTTAISEGTNKYYTEERVSANADVSANTTARHTHSNKTILDNTTASYTTAEQTKLSGLSNYILPTASTTVLGGVKVDGSTITINNGIISGSSGQTLYSTTNSGTSYAGQWTKLATIALTAQGQSVAVSSLRVFRYLEGVLKNESVNINLTVAQESQLANAPTVSLSLANMKGNYFSGARIVLTLDENSATQTVVSLRIQAWSNNEFFSFIPLITNNDGSTISLLSNQSYSSSISVYRYADNEVINAGNIQVNNTTVIDPYGFVDSGERVTRLQYAETRDSASGSPVEGMFYFNKTDKHFYGYNGTTWKQLDN